MKVLNFHVLTDRSLMCMHVEHAANVSGTHHRYVVSRDLKKSCQFSHYHWNRWPLKTKTVSWVFCHPWEMSFLQCDISAFLLLRVLPKMYLCKQMSFAFVKLAQILKHRSSGWLIIQWFHTLKNQCGEQQSAIMVLYGCAVNAKYQSVGYGDSSALALWDGI